MQQTPTPAPEVAASILRLATMQLADISEADERPLVVVFIDHFERLQTDDRRSGESIVNRLIGALPHCLFVITGRNRIDWDDPGRTDLRHCGPRTWPQLVQGYVERNPRQHGLGMLSERDAESVYRRRARRQGFALSDDTIARLVRRPGWPVHIDAVCTLASTLAGGSGAEVMADDLDLPLGTIVRGVMENLTENQARAFHGACLLPYFDIRLAASVACVPEGDVAGMVRRAMVEPNADPDWGYRVHDTIRDLVRHAPASVMGGWTQADWAAAAVRGLDEAKRRFDEAVAAGDDERVIGAVILGTTIAAEHGVWDQWLDDDRAPAERVAPLIPSSSAHPEADARVRYLRARTQPRGIAPLKEFREIFNGDSVTARRAGLWRAYSLRAWGHPLAAVHQLELARSRFPDWELPARQIGNTLLEARRFRDACDYANAVDEKTASYVRSSLALVLGELTSAEVTPFETRIASAKTIRFKSELQCSHAKWLLRTVGCTSEAIERHLVRAREISHLGGQRNCHFVLACLNLASADSFERELAELLILSDSRGKAPLAAVEAQALRALLTGRSADARYARELAADRPRRTSHWIPVEIYMDALGVPLDPVATQWIDPFEEVEARWLAIAEGIISRATERHGRPHLS